MDHDFSICGLRIRFCVPWQVQPTGSTRPFLITGPTSGEPDLTVSFCPVEQLHLPQTGGVWNADSCYLSREGLAQIWHCPVRGEAPYCHVYWQSRTPQTVTCEYVPGSEHRIAYARNLLALLGLETLLLPFGALILHASVIDWQGMGILFCAPSGTGKSTQASLWERHTGSRILNGDRAAVRREQGVWRVWGSPYAGTSGIYCNASVPIRAVVLLRQSAVDTIERVHPMEAFRGLLPECSAQRWDEGFMDRLVSILSGLVSQVPVYRLACRPEPGAVELLRDTLMEGGAVWP